MKKKLAKKYTKQFLYIGATSLLINLCSGCGPRAENLYQQAYSEIEKGHFRIAADLLEKSSKIEKDNLTKYKYLNEATRIVRFEIQDYDRAVRYLRQIILLCFPHDLFSTTDLSKCQR